MEKDKQEVINFWIRLPWVLQRYLRASLYKFYRFLFPKKLQKIFINAVHEEEVEILLNQLDLLDKFKTKKLFCAFCGKLITESNLYAIHLTQENIAVYCDNHVYCPKFGSKNI